MVSKGKNRRGKAPQNSSNASSSAASISTATGSTGAPDSVPLAPTPAAPAEMSDNNAFSDTEPFVPESFLASMLRIKRSLSRTAPLALDLGTGLQRELKHCALTIEGLANELPDATLKALAHRRDVKSLNTFKWLYTMRRNNSDDRKTLSTDAGILEAFVAKYESTALREQLAVPEQPSSAYPHLRRLFLSSVNGFLWNHSSMTLGVQFNRNKGDFRGRGPISAPLTHWHIYTIPSTEEGDIILSFDDISAVPPVAKALNIFARNLYSGIATAKAMTSMKKELLGDWHTSGIDKDLKYLVCSRDVRKGAPNGLYWAFNYRKENFLLMKSRMDGMIGDFPDTVERLRPKQAEITIEARHDSAHFAASAEQIELVKRWAQGVVAITDAGAHSGSTASDIHTVVNAYTNTATRTVKVQSKHERYLTWELGKPRLYLEREGLDVNVIFRIPSSVSKNDVESLWKALKGIEADLWRFGLLFSLILDLSHAAAGDIVDRLANAVYYNPADEMEKLSGSTQYHDTIAEKVLCTDERKCECCGEAYRCSMASWYDVGLCPRHEAIYRGSPNSRQTPLLISIRHNADLAKRDDQRAAEFMAATTDALLVPSGLVCLTVEFSGSDTYRSADNRLEDCVVKHAADRPLGFETVLSSFSDVKRGVTGYRLSAIVSLKHDNSKSALQSQDVAIEDVPAYKSHLHGVISYNHFAAPRSLVSSLDQSRPFFVDEQGAITMGHVAGNIDVLPLHLNYLKHTYPPEWINVIGLQRFKICCLQPEFDADPALASTERNLEEDRQHIFTAFHELSLLVPYTNHSRRVAGDKEALCRQIQEAYKPIVAFGKRAGFPYTTTAEVPSNSRPQNVKAAIPTVAPVAAVPVIAIRELLQLTPSDVSDILYRHGSNAAASAFVESLKNDLQDLKKELDVQLASSSSSSGLIDVDDVSNDRLMVYSIRFVLFKKWHYLLMIEWCDEYGMYWIAFIFLTFFIVNLFEIRKVNGRCPKFGFPVTCKRKDLAAFADAHRIHGLSMGFKIQGAVDVRKLTDVRHELSNIEIQSRSANYWLSNFRTSEVIAANAQLLEIGLQSFINLYPELQERLLQKEAYCQALSQIPLGKLNTGIGPNHYWDLHESHILHPSQGNTHVTC